MRGPLRPGRATIRQSARRRVGHDLVRSAALFQEPLPFLVMPWMLESSDRPRGDQGHYLPWCVAGGRHDAWLPTSARAGPGGLATKTVSTVSFGMSISHLAAVSSEADGFVRPCGSAKAAFSIGKPTMARRRWVRFPGRLACEELVDRPFRRDGYPVVQTTRWRRTAASTFAFTATHARRARECKNWRTPSRVERSGAGEATRPDRGKRAAGGHSALRRTGPISRGPRECPR